MSQHDQHVKERHAVRWYQTYADLLGCAKNGCLCQPYSPPLEVDFDGDTFTSTCTDCGEIQVTKLQKEM